ncbi:Hypothetical predicted protein [Olea europaea subsp. europaea]|uniref:Uncharacterized protein n=1 Tax=Olea europaea subsp. europaea TaxID=158383 RepID=A0A8S0SEP5_OLEEU|nr:Hypothetical predicted protein [Olea europaea subsp. europaea]
MRRARRRNTPAVPETMDGLFQVLQVNRYRHLAVTADGKQPLLAGITGSEGHRALVFASPRMLKWSKHTKVLIVDATFKSRPFRPWCAQVLHLVALFDGCVSVL